MHTFRDFGLRSRDKEKGKQVDFDEIDEGDMTDDDEDQDPKDDNNMDEEKQAKSSVGRRLW